MEYLDMELKDLQPSQFWISERKLRDVEAWLNPEDLSGFEPIPVKCLDGRQVMTDGHTRAVAALRAGLRKVPLVREMDDLDWDMYRACVDACLERNIDSPAALLDRVLSAEEKKEEIRKDQEREQDTYSQNKYYNELMEKGQKLIRLIEKHKNAKNSELKKFLKEVDKLVSRWD